MAFMVRALVLAMIFLVARGVPGQPTSVLHIRVFLVNAGGKASPVPGHALLVSDNPTSALPRRVVTRADGTVDVNLRPGNYTVESDRPAAFDGKAYAWTQMVDVAAGRDAVLELTAGNAEVVPVTAATSSGTLAEADPSASLMRWQDTVVALWTPTVHASGVLVDARGLIATNQRVIGSAASVEVQLAPDVKVAARVLAADGDRNVAILWVDPKIVATVRPLSLACAPSASPALANGQEIFALGAPLRQPKGIASGTVSRVDMHAVVSDLVLATGSAGGPVFTADGSFVGITAPLDEAEERWRGDARVVRADRLCNVLALAEEKMKRTAPPSGTRLPVEPLRPFPVDVLKKAASGRAGSLSPYQMASADFDIAFITPVLTFGAQDQAEQASGRDRNSGGRAPDSGQPFVRPLMDFSNWSEYVMYFPPVLLVRITPKFVEGLWTKVARGAAQTQGVSLPPIKHFKSDFLRLRAFCGEAEVRPVHPFKLEQRVSDTDVIYEGLYVFDPGALGPGCGTVKLVLYSEKEPEKADTRVVDPKILQQISQDFEPYRTEK